MNTIKSKFNQNLDIIETLHQEKAQLLDKIHKLEEEVIEARTASHGGIIYRRPRSSRCRGVGATPQDPQDPQDPRDPRDTPPGNQSIAVIVIEGHTRQGTKGGRASTKAEGMTNR